MPMECNLPDGGAAGTWACLEGQVTWVRRSSAPVGLMQPLMPISTGTILYLGPTSHYHGIYVWFHWRNLISYWLIKNHKKANTPRSTSGGKLTQRQFLVLVHTQPVSWQLCIVLFADLNLLHRALLLIYPEKHIVHTYMSNGNCCVTVVGGRGWPWRMNCKLWMWIWWKDSGLQYSRKILVTSNVAVPGSCWHFLSQRLPAQ